MLETNYLGSGRLCLSCPAEVLRKQESWAERRGAALFSSEERVEWKESAAATSPAAHWHFARSLCPEINSPGEPASLLNLNVLENWNDYQIAHLRGLQKPQGSEPGGGQTRSLTAALTPGRAREAHSGESTVPREACPAPEPRHLSTDAQMQAWSFPDRGQARPAPGSPCPSAESTRSGLNVLIVESTRSHLNIISANRIWSLNLPRRQNLVRFKLF